MIDRYKKDELGATVAVGDDLLVAEVLKTALWVERGAQSRALCSCWLRVL